MLENLKSVDDEYINSVMNPADIENANEIHLEQHSRAIDNSGCHRGFCCKISRGSE